MTARREIPLVALRLVLPALAILVAVAARGPAGAHEFTLESLMTGFVKIEPGRAHLVVRVPLHVLKSARFPAMGREIDLTNADAAVERAVTQLGREIAILEDGRRLTPSSAVGRLT